LTLFSQAVAIPRTLTASQKSSLQHHGGRYLGRYPMNARLGIRNRTK
jgi:hypothetical protein